MDDNAHQEEMVVPNGTKGQGNEEGITEDANGHRPVGESQVSGGDY